MGGGGCRCRSWLRYPSSASSNSCSADFPEACRENHCLPEFLLHISVIEQRYSCYLSFPGSNKNRRPIQDFRLPFLLALAHSHLACNSLLHVSLAIDQPLVSPCQLKSQPRNN